MEIKKFENINGHLAIGGKYERYKFCSICAHKLAAKLQKLKAHLKGQHGMSEGNFLPYKEQPTYNKYSNWAEYLANPSIKLVEKNGIMLNKGGKPLKIKQVFTVASKQEGALTTAEESASPRTIPSQIGISKHLNFGGP